MSDQSARTRSAAGPRWTRRRLLAALSACYGAGASADQPDIAAVAAGFGVTAGTVRRWLAGDSGRGRPRIPERRLRELQVPPALVLENEQMVADNARRVVEGLRLPRGRDRVRQQDWLEPHLVAVIELPADAGGIRLRQISMTRGTPKQVDRLQRRGGLVDFTTVPSRYHAIALINDVMTLVGPWRLYPGENVTRDSRTQTWAHDAPAFNIASLAVALDPE
ncbi:hypothetical protein AB0N05_37875 [Nocardia sp. NPDC051030]|uniref:hypothetical protein n=1 Tax=Nocardia sp. NPDC051030 TaxID=3155162 RepID=UPI0034278BCB